MKIVPIFTSAAIYSSASGLKNHILKNSNLIRKRIMEIFVEEALQDDSDIVFKFGLISDTQYVDAEDGSNFNRWSLQQSSSINFAVTTNSAQICNSQVQTKLGNIEAGIKFFPTGSS